MDIRTFVDGVLFDTHTFTGMDKKEALGRLGATLARAEFVTNMCVSSLRVAETTPVCGVMKLLSQELAAIRDEIRDVLAGMQPKPRKRKQPEAPVDKKRKKPKPKAKAKPPAYAPPDYPTAAIEVSK